MVSSAPLDLSAWAVRDERRRAQARRVCEHVEARIEALRAVLAAHGVRQAYVFGSVASGVATAESDLDIAVRGVVPQRFYRLAAELERAAAMRTDVVDLDTAPPDLAEAIADRARRIWP